MIMSISDIIEKFILNSIGEDEYISISRNQLAEYFNCVPSQINYVLTTRFTLDKGFVVESKRGGGGYINIVRVDEDKIKYLNSLISGYELRDLSIIRAKQILERLAKEKLITKRESDIINSGLSDKALLVPDSIKKQVRANILRNILNEILKSIE